MTGSRSRLPNTRKTANRANRRKLPVETAIITTAAEASTPRFFGSPR
jgi:hypothetical protein